MEGGPIGVRTDPTVRRLLSVDEVAEVLGVPVKTLYQWRHKGVGPLGLRVGRHLRYRAADVSEWIDRRAAPPRRRAPGVADTPARYRRPASVAG